VELSRHGPIYLGIAQVGFGRLGHRDFDAAVS
jgi:hypothetical protein